jgi:hypothetical protein
VPEVTQKQWKYEILVNKVRHKYQSLEKVHNSIDVVEDDKPQSPGPLKNVLIRKMNLARGSEKKKKHSSRKKKD